MEYNGTVSRRTFLVRSGFIGAAAIAAPTLAGCGSSSAQAGGSKASVTYATDSSLGPLLTPVIQQFSSEYAPLSAQLSLIPTNYETVIQTKFESGAGGIDVVFSNAGYADYWYESGWIQALDGLPGLAQMNADIYPQSLKQDLFSSTDGKQIAIPYYSNTQLFTYNKSLLNRHGIAVPTTWDEFTTACQKLKKGGIAHPFAPFWDSDFGTIVFSFFAHCASQGMTQAFTTNKEPTFDTSAVSLEVLEQWQNWFKDGLVASDILSSDYASVAGLFNAGDAAFAVASGQFIKPWATTPGTPVYKNTAIAMMPGTSRGTFTEMATYMMAKSASDRQSAWELMRFLSWRDTKDRNAYVTPTKYLLKAFGLFAPYKGLLSEPATAELMSFLDYGIYKEQAALAQNMLYPADHAPWFAGWQTAMASQLQAAIVGHSTAAQALKSGADYVRSHQKS
jgi:multiple sugar transport system substrate-binding protein